MQVLYLEGQDHMTVLQKRFWIQSKLVFSRDNQAMLNQSNTMHGTCWPCKISLHHTSKTKSEVQKLCHNAKRWRLTTTIKCRKNKKRCSLRGKLKSSLLRRSKPKFSELTSYPVWMTTRESWKEALWPSKIWASAPGKSTFRSTRLRFQRSRSWRNWGKVIK